MFDENDFYYAKPPAAGFDLKNVIRRIFRGKYIILGASLLGIAGGVVATLTVKPWYYAQAVFLPPKYTDLATTTPASSLLLGASDASDVYLGLLVSRSVQDDVVDRLNLKVKYRLNSQGAARAKLFADSNFGVGRNALVFVTVKAGDPQLAADIANAYLDALYRLNSEMTGSSSDLRRVFFEQQMQQQRAELTHAEQDLKQTEEKTGLLLPTSEAQVGLSVIAGLQAQIGDAEARLAGLLVGETDQAPEVRAARAQLAPAPRPTRHAGGRQLRQSARTRLRGKSPRPHPAERREAARGEDCRGGL